ncbi:MAG TPA: arginine deiminase family protein [Gaiellales bacterium]|jgi:dimethylargininase|nr:arginine deiminase family protein [Gaiellales bacterium]
MSTRTFGAQSMTAPLRDVLVKRPAAAFGAAFDDPAVGFLHPVDLAAAQREHDTFTALLSDLGASVHELGDEHDPDLTYTFDPALVTDRGVVPLRPGKPNRVGEELVIEGWCNAHGIPTAGRIESPGTAEGGDTFWLDDRTLCVGRTLRTNRAGVAQLVDILQPEVEVEVFDVPYWKGPAELIHLMSVISPIADDLAVVFMPLLPCGLLELLQLRGVRMVEVPEEEFLSLGCNVLAVAPGVAVMADGNPVTRARLEAAGAEVHVFQAGEVGVNGSGGPTCLTRPILRG